MCSGILARHYRTHDLLPGNPTMAHRYGEPVTVTLRDDGLPATFTWRGTVYHVRAVLAKWHLMDRWWVRPGEPPPPSTGHPLHPLDWRRSNRYYCRLEVEDHMVFDLYCDAARRPPVWILDRV